MSKHYGFGVDIGGSGIKGAPVDLKKGAFLKERFRIPPRSLRRRNPWRR